MGSEDDGEMPSAKSKKGKGVENLRKINVAEFEDEEEDQSDEEEESASMVREML